MNLVLSITILASKLNRRVLSVLCVLKIAPKDDFNRKHIGILWCVVFGLRTTWTTGLVNEIQELSHDSTPALKRRNCENGNQRVLKNWGRKKLTVCMSHYVQALLAPVLRSCLALIDDYSLSCCGPGMHFGSNWRPRL
jgi:hypothetical protein